MKRKIFISILFSSLAIFFTNCEKDVSVSPPDKQPPNGYLKIESKPSGFQIFMEGKDRRRITPDSITWLKTGTYKFTLKKNLFRDTTFSHDVAEGEKRKTFIDYTKNPAMLGSIKITSNPAASSITINDSATGLLTPTTIKGLLPGYYEIKLNAKDHRDKKFIVTVESSKISDVNVTLVDTTVWNDYTTTNSNITTNNLSCIYSDNNKNEIIIGSFFNGLYIFKNNKFENFNLNNTGIVSDKINAIAKVSSKTIWIANNNGVLIYENGSFSNLFPNYARVPTRDIKAIGFDFDNNILLGTSIGLLRGFVGKDSIVWRLASTQNTFKQGTSISSIFNDNNEYVWIGTQSMGIIRYSKSDTVIFKKPQFLVPSNNSVSGTKSLIDRKIYFLHDPEIASIAGVSVFNISYQKNIPLNYNGISSRNIFCDSKNRIWLATSYGIIRITNESVITLFDDSKTGLELSEVNGISEDGSGNIYFTTNGSGLIKLKKPDINPK